MAKKTPDPTWRELSARGGRAAQAKLTPAQKTEKMRKALKVRWDGYRARQAAAQKQDDGVAA